MRLSTLKQFIYDLPMFYGERVVDVVGYMSRETLKGYTAAPRFPIRGKGSIRCFYTGEVVCE